MWSFSRCQYILPEVQHQAVHALTRWTAGSLDTGRVCECSNNYRVRIHTTIDQYPLENNCRICPKKSSNFWQFLFTLRHSGQHLATSDFWDLASSFKLSIPNGLALLLVLDKKTQSNDRWWGWKASQQEIMCFCLVLFKYHMLKI